MKTSRMQLIFAVIISLAAWTLSMGLAVSLH